MKAALVMEAGQAPVYGDFKEPVAATGQHRIRVSAASLNQITRSRASGMHYSSAGGLPFVAGIDGVGMTEDGQRVYFVLPEHPYGALADYCVMDARRCIALPAGLSDVDAAAMANPGMSSWAALVERAQIRAGETVLINGANGISGRLAIQIARHLGAGKIIATARQQASADALRHLGADQVIVLEQDALALEAACQEVFSQGVDIVLDYLWGSSAETLLIGAAKAAPEAVPIRFVQIGAASGGDLRLPAAVLRASALQLMGSGIGSIPLPRLLQALKGVLAAAPEAGFTIATRLMPLAQVSQAWALADGSARIVLQP